MREFNSNAQIAGIGVCVPDRTVYTKDLPFDSEQELQTFLKKIGGAEKRVSNGKLTAADLGVKAARTLLASLQWPGDSVDLLISVTQSPDYQVPGNAFRLHHALGLKTECHLLDMNAGCTGWVQALVQCHALMATMSFKRALIITGETNILSNAAEINSFRLMGDGATATAVTATAAPVSYWFSETQEAENADAIRSNRSGAAHLKATAERGLSAEGYDHSIQMNGEKMQLFITRSVVPAIEAFLSDLPFQPSKYFIHQPNKLHFQYIIRKLKLEAGNAPNIIDDFGNVSSSSIPMAMHRWSTASGSPRSKVACHAFGVGLSIAHLAFELEPIVCPPLIELPVDA